jgi:hypothetical protein
VWVNTTLNTVREEMHKFAQYETLTANHHTPKDEDEYASALEFLLDTLGLSGDDPILHLPDSPEFNSWESFISQANVASKKIQEVKGALGA